MSDTLTHLDAQGQARMVDVGGKDVSARRAVATSFVRMSPAARAALAPGANPKGDVFATARIAAPAIERTVYLARADIRPQTKAAREVGRIAADILRTEARRKWWRARPAD